MACLKVPILFIALYLLVGTHRSTRADICSGVELRTAAASGGDFKFRCNGTYVLSEPLTVTTNLTLDGAGHQITIDGGGLVRLFNVGSNVVLTLKNLVLANGAAIGKAQAPATTDNTSEDNSALGGAVVATNAFITIDSCLITNCVVKGTEAPGLPPVFGRTAGGSIYAQGGELLLVKCEFRDCHALPGSVRFDLSAWEGPAEGGAVWANGASVTLRQTVLSGCSGSSEGGGALALHNCTLHVTDCEFTTNALTGVLTVARKYTAASARGGAMRLLSTPAWITNSIFRSNSISSSGSRYGTGIVVEGGAIYTDSSLQLNSCLFEGNLALAPESVTPADHTAGAAIFSLGPLDIQFTAFRGNAAISALAVFGGLPPAGASESLGGSLFAGGETILLNSDFFDNSVRGGPAEGASVWGTSAGGAIFSTNRLSATNVSFASNHVSRIEGAPQQLALGGALFLAGNENHIEYCTFFSDAIGSAPYSELTPLSNFPFTPLPYPGSEITIPSNAAMVLHGSIVAGTSSNLVVGSITDGGHNITTDSFLSHPASRNNTDPQLDSVVSNGGFVQAFALRATSPARNAGDPAYFPATDALGNSRPIGNGADIGAFESQAAGPALTISKADGTATIQLFGLSQGTFLLQQSSDLKTWHSIQTTNLSASAIQIPVGLDHSQFYRVAY